MKNYQIAIIGGGFFGLYLAEFFSKLGKSVVVLEKESDAMQRASYVNQARVHNGYHYPRSILTALRSRISFPRFVDEFSSCIKSDFDKYYMISTKLGKVSPNQFVKFCERIGATCDPAPNHIRKLTNPQMIDAIYRTKEYAFDSSTLKEIMLDRLDKPNLDLFFESRVVNINKSGSSDELQLTIESELCDNIITANQVFNCTYSLLNSVLSRSGIDLIPLRHEMTEMAIVEMPDDFSDLGITVMCGPFFSAMPFPSKNAHSFSHVRYTPHYEWNDGSSQYIDAHEHYNLSKKKSAWKSMQLDAQRYIPSFRDIQYKESIWEVKTILPRSDSDDSRPILFKANYAMRGFHCIMGGKIDNVYDAIKTIIDLGLDR
ncbi:D amino acid oxidase [Vibrio cholerae]|uniref:FAD-dependent oxidoreductase n=1 Tax=Vibrio cholerae TaxID=666 RepID=UPI0000EF9593|nr:FAD-dependent oxidoreductase [Vibrio cholerae]EGR2082404.1 FAD-dependent oxidoreductase [Vibrio cholerae]EGR4062118.1 FAD-dependent oxidoreductase [Vibrio cholerae]EGR4421116.1 FAD-dependent oxidoreductase [Vibrio cholerae]EGR4432016.1 FAD-dependent oxidoreductase [Vibrio cholerae]EKF9146709.1 FAD-dependent oxidoreductase [Vibrio cholerae]